MPIDTLKQLNRRNWILGLQYKIFTALTSNKMKEVLYGSAPVLAALRAGRRTLHRLFVASPSEGIEGDKLLENAVREKALSLARAANVPIVRSLPKFGSGSSQATHNGLMLEVGPLHVTSLRALSGLTPLEPSGFGYSASVSDKETIDFEFDPPLDTNHRFQHPLWLALDQLNDPQNLGAIIRTASFFGIDGIVMTTTNTAPLSPVVSKASAGALESYPMLYATRNLPSFLGDCRQAGWAVFGTDITGNPTAKVYSCWQRPAMDQPLVLVMGSEGSGIRKTVSAKCDAHLLIPGGQSHDENDNGKGLLDSLNVSVATGILLSSLSRK
ncbi:Alpha/beta knot methyltransferase [Chytriomyces sp. MP71]|nr:Alpha/beta knot methyltransferase [Chytriomyces sp. MP71]